MPDILSKQFHFYLNPDKIKDAYLLDQIKKEKNLSGLVKNLLYNYYKYSNPFAAKLKDAKHER